MGRVQMVDVNETLLDLAAIGSALERIFGIRVRVAWFCQMISSARVATVTDAYRHFGDHAMAALEMTAEQAGVALANGDRETVADQLRWLPAPRSPMHSAGWATPVPAGRADQLDRGRGRPGLSTPASSTPSSRSRRPTQ